MTTMNELTAAAEFLNRKFPHGGRVLCAVSGGLDSMCLLDYMTRQPSFSVGAAHFNHCLRGAEADRDEEFVRDHCGKRRIPFVSGSGDTRLLAEKEDLSIEEAARRLRYEFLNKAAEDGGYDAILTAHHADDNAETVLLNLVRGTGSAGLAGIPQVRGNICRPFLRIPRAELAAYAAAHGVPHVEDSTNDDPDAAARNALRSSVMPVLRQINPKCVENIARTSAILRDESDALESMARGLMNQIKELPDGVSVPCLMLTEVPQAVAERAVLQLIAQVAGHRKDLTAAHVLAVLDLARGRRTDLEVSLPYGMTARRKKYTLEITQRPARPVGQPIAVGDTVEFGAAAVSLSEQDSPGALPMRLPEGVPMTVTSWHPGDWLRVPGSRGPRSFKRLCAERGISPGERDALPVLRVGETHAADPVFGVQPDFAPCPGGQTVFLKFYKKTEESKYEK